MQLSCKLPVLVVGRDEGAEGDNAGVGEQLADLSHTPDVLLSVLRRETEVLVEAGSDNKLNYSN